MQPLLSNFIPVRMRLVMFFFFLKPSQKEDWPMHKLECSPMVVFGENWNPSETVRLTARILAKQVRKRNDVQVHFILFLFFLKGQKDGQVTDGDRPSLIIPGHYFPSRPYGWGGGEWELVCLLPCATRMSLTPG